MGPVAPASSGLRSLEHQVGALHATFHILSRRLVGRRRYWRSREINTRVGCLCPAGPRARPNRSTAHLVGVSPEPATLGANLNPTSASCSGSTAVGAPVSGSDPV